MATQPTINTHRFPVQITRTYVARKLMQLHVSSDDPADIADEYLVLRDELVARGWGYETGNADINWFMEGFLTRPVRQELARRGERA